jgi:hypothetical protein
VKFLEQKGFHLKYIAYVQEGFPDNSQERLNRGDFDAIDITKDAYHMRLEYGDNSATYDIYTSGFEIPSGGTNPTPDPNEVLWPSEVYGAIPRPARCPLVSVEQVPPQEYHITCQPADNAVADDYKQALQASGYLPNIHNPASDGSLDGSIYAWGSWEISVDQPSSGLILIKIVNTTLPEPTKEYPWPTELKGVVLQPENCPISSSIPMGGPSNFLIGCKFENQQVVLDYMDQLLSDGFAETRRLQTPEGLLISADYEKGDLKVGLWLLSNKELSIRITAKP